ncbi:MAG: hypothetical protein ABIK79_04565 [Chloroflexota bacterium]
MNAESQALQNSTAIRLSPNGPTAVIPVLVQGNDLQVEVGFLIMTVYRSLTHVVASFLRGHTLPYLLNREEAGTYLDGLFPQPGCACCADGIVHVYARADDA